MGKHYKYQAEEEKNLNRLVFQSKENRTDAREEKSILCASSGPNDLRDKLYKKRNKLLYFYLSQLL